MEELSIEQKAQRYDEAIEIAKDSYNYPSYPGFIRADVVFPELAESEDERIRKMLISSVKGELIVATSEEREKAIAWLEKQGEHANFLDKIQIGDKVTRNEDGVLVNLSQLNRVAKPADKVEPKFKVGDVIRLKGSAAKYTIKRVTDTTYYTNGWSCSIERCEEDYELVEKKPSAWSEEDERQARQIGRIVHDDGCTQKLQEQIADWLKSIKDRVQPKQEWSEEDKNHVKSILSTIECCKAQFPNAQAVVEAYNADAEWLNSLRPQNIWKPSDEQIEALHDTIIYVKDSMFPSKNVLKKLYGQLKKLREE